MASKEEILYAICLTVTEEPNAQNLPLLDAPGTAADRLSALVRGHLHHLRRRRTEHIVGGELSLDEVADGYVDLIVGRMLGGRERNSRSDRRFHSRPQVRTRRAAASRPRRAPSVCTAPRAYALQLGRDGQVGVNRVSHRR